MRVVITGALVFRLFFSLHCAPKEADIKCSSAPYRAPPRCNVANKGLAAAIKLIRIPVNVGAKAQRGLIDDRGSDSDRSEEMREQKEAAVSGPSACRR